MSDDIDLGEEDGYAVFRMGKGEDAPSVRLDVDGAWHAIRAFHAANKELPDQDYNEALVRLMQEMGFPPCSHHMAAKFVRAVNHRVESLKKKPDPWLDSPASTASTPST